jgi:hypothetical protein
MTKLNKSVIASKLIASNVFLIMAIFTGCGISKPSRSSLANHSAKSNVSFSGLIKSDFYSISAGYSHTCTIDDEGIKCWGDNHFGQINVPSGLENPRSVSARGLHTCAIDDEGVKCWGDNQLGQINVPSGLKNPRSVSAGLSHTCAIDYEGVKCWGDDYHGETEVPEGLKNPKSVSTGMYHSCVIDSDGVKCWGHNENGQTEAPAGLKYPRSVSAGGYHTCAIDDEGVKCWGFNANGQTNVPVGLKNPRIVSAGEMHTCVIDDGGVKCWGDNAKGQTEVPAGLKYPRFVSAGHDHTCVIDDEGVKCWGGNDQGQTDVLNLVVNNSIEFLPWPQILSQFTIGDKHQFFSNIQNSIFLSLAKPVMIDSKEHQLLVHLMTRYVSEFSSDYFRQVVSPKWRDSLKIIERKTGIISAADIPQTPGTLTVAVKLLNAAFIAVKPMLSSPEQREVDDVVLKINASLSREMTQAAARGVVKEIRKHQTLMAAIAASDAVHVTSVVVDDASHWIMKD